MEITPRRSIDAHHIAAEGRVGGIHIKDRPFGVVQFQSHSQDDLPQLLDIGTWWIVARHAHHLHRERTATAHHLACLHVVDKRLDERHWVEARMEEEPAVLVLKEAGDVLRGIAVRGGETPLPVVGNLRAEQFAVPRRQHRRVRLLEARHGDAEEGDEKARKGQR